MELSTAVVGALLVGMLALMIAFFVRDALNREEKVSLVVAGRQRQKRKATTLWVLILLSIAYIGLLRLLGTLTGMDILDGIIGLAFGLYICSHPAANAVNMLFFERQSLRQTTSGWPVVRWLALNLVTLLAGWLVVFIGITRLVNRTA